MYLIILVNIDYFVKATKYIIKMYMRQGLWGREDWSYVVSIVITCEQSDVQITKMHVRKRCSFLNWVDLIMIYTKTKSIMRLIDKW